MALPVTGYSFRAVSERDGTKQDLPNKVTLLVENWPLST